MRRRLDLPAVLTTITSTTLLIVIASSSHTGAQAQLAALPEKAPAPADNPTTPDRVALGRLLFWDPILSGQQDVACATCHHPDFGYSDSLDLAIGTNGIGHGPARTFGDAPAHFVKRNSQTVLNAAFNGLTTRSPRTAADAPMFWDMRVRSLETQALQPIKALEEMRGGAYEEGRALSAVVSRLAANDEYRRLFARAFGGRNPVTEENLGRALAAFERTIVAANAPFDRYMRGDQTALTDAQVRGMERFQSIGCVTCHNGPMFSDYTAHVLAVPDNRKLEGSDAGVNDTYAFRTASLRNLAVTAPYMHNGVFSTLPQVIDFYARISRGGGPGRGRGGQDGRGLGPGRGGGPGAARGINRNVRPDQIDPLVRQLNLGGRGQPDLIAFLAALNDSGFDRTVPERVPSGLPVGGRLQR